MYTEMNTGNEVPIRQGNQAPFDGSWLDIPQQVIPHQTGFLSNNLGNLPGESIWPHFDTEGIYSLPLKMQTFDSSTSSCHSYNEGEQVKVPLSVSEVSTANNRNGDISKMGCNSMMTKTANIDDGFPWGHMISLMSAPPYSPLPFPVNGVSNESISTTSHVNSAPYSSSLSYSNLAPQTPIKGPLGLGDSQMAVRSSASGADIHAMPASLSHERNSLKQHAMGTPQQVSYQSGHYYANGYKKPNFYYQDGSNQIQPNESCSLNQSQTSYLASDNAYGSITYPDFLPGEFSVPYQEQSHYTQNYTSASSTSGITNTSMFAPPIPHPVSSSGIQHNFTPRLPVDQHPRVQTSLTMTSYPSFAPPNPPLEQHLQDSTGLFFNVDRNKNQANIQLQSLAVPPVNDPVKHVCQETHGDIMDYPTAIGTPQKERDTSEAEDGQSIDLNKTPPQKTPKRKKHRPKVIREKKPPKNRKPSTPKVGPDGTILAKRKYGRKNKPDIPDTPLEIAENGKASNMEPTPKRKYVRKNKPNHPETLLSEVAENDEASSMEPTSTSCRRSLNFDLEKIQRSADTNCHTVLHGTGSPKKLEEAKQQRLQYVHQKQQHVPAFKQPSGSTAYQRLSEQESSGALAAPSTISVSSLLLCQENFQNKRKKVDNGYHANIKETEYSAIHAGVQNRNQTERMLNHFTQEELLNSSLEVDTNRSPRSGLSSSVNECKSYSSYYCMNVQRKHMSSSVAAWPGNTPKSGENQSASSPMFSLLCAGALSTIQTHKPFYKTLSAESAGKPTVNRTACSSMLVKHRTPTIPKKRSQSRALDKKQKNMVSVEDIVELLGCLNLRATDNEMVQHNLNALVPYKADGSIVPYEKFEPLKKRKARPKVDLDPETNRLWNVLMGKVIAEDEKKTDEEKAKWWEGERKVFRGRADSFIARMHLVQGDRRFSPWKGSVVDSVIGVFLTQNVTDHVSSSAFMSLAARFSFQPTRADGASLGDGLSVIIQEPDDCILETNGESPRHKELNQNVYAKTSGRLVNQDNHDLSSSSVIQHLADGKSWRLDEVISSQDSAESSNLQATGGIQSLESRSRDCYMNDGKSYGKHHTTPFNLEEVNDTVRLLDSTIQVTGNSYYEASTKGYLQFQNATGASEKKQMDSPNTASAMTASHNLFDLNCSYWQMPYISSNDSQFPLASSSGSCSAGILGMQNLKCSMSLNSTASGVTLVDNTGITSEQIGQELQGGTVSLQNIPAKAQYPLPNIYAFADMLSAEMMSVMPAGGQGYHQNAGEDQYIDKNSSFQFNKVKEAFHTKVKMSQTSVTVHECPGQTTHVDESGTMVENRAYEENRVEATNFNEQVCSSIEESRGLLKSGRKSRNGGSEGKRVSFDWDSLRKQAQVSSDLKERRNETADSMDYEALRHADVKDISQAIRERGMNNMLAERMKDFLNRVAQDHGSVDLEWLRDVPPEKAKDYLLSIRGLGLKSVECVRLLSLHQHAFPVDTNVGRIAVRLGWVPLQPLPESLQLHLLEMYPILESIQKYLWPRLCNLDQRTLYELHYQLITFGKVFCTKSKPNCNACPMRGECRHFASAFASSRLALPGPEDKSIVTSDVPITATKITPIAINPMPLQSLEGIPYDVAKSDLRCEPIVEEPSTPEPEITETSEIDIEDVYDDTDEIPTIRLNVEEFAMNLQSFMQGNMELLEGDMSKALVALDPKAASIPTPKLKNVSRLRTEHQVYQLPDSHPLLKELEEREPDDPSPYLLAIWTPGETAESIELPEGTCSSQELGRLCDENTCFACNTIRERNAETVRGTLLIPCRTAMRGSFPLNGTYFQVNEVFADHESSLNPINVPRSWIWNLQRRTVYFGTSATTIFRGMSTEDIQYCFWRGFVCVRGFDRESRAPRPLMARLHFPASKRGQPTKEETNNSAI